MVPELITVLGSQPAGDVSHKPGGRLPLLFARPGYNIFIQFGDNIKTARQLRSAVFAEFFD